MTSSAKPTSACAAGDYSKPDTCDPAPRWSGHRLTAPAGPPNTPWSVFFRSCALAPIKNRVEYASPSAATHSLRPARQSSRRLMRSAEPFDHDTTMDRLSLEELALRPILSRGIAAA